MEADTIQRTAPSQSARSGCQLSQRESQGRFAPQRITSIAIQHTTLFRKRRAACAKRFLSGNEPGGLGNQRIRTIPAASLSGGTAAAGGCYPPLQGVCIQSSANRVCLQYCTMEERLTMPIKASLSSTTGTKFWVEARSISSCMEVVTRTGTLSLRR